MERLDGVGAIEFDEETTRKKIETSIDQLDLKKMMTPVRRKILRS